MGQRNAAYETRLRSALLQDLEIGPEMSLGYFTAIRPDFLPTSSPFGRLVPRRLA